MNERKMSLNVCATGSILLFSLALAVFGSVAMADDKGTELVAELSETRGEIVLNGIWKFQPGDDSNMKIPGSDWGSIRVPGAWHTTTFLEGVLESGKDKSWSSVNWKELSRAWYERLVFIPNNWKDRAVVLQFDRVCTDAFVYVNGQSVGAVKWPGGEIDITKFVTPGETAKMTVEVLASTSQNEIEQYMDAKVSFKRKAVLKARGLTGDVLLVSRPKGALIDSLFIQTSVQNKKIQIQADVKDVASAGTAAASIVIIDKEGREAKRWEQTVQLDAKPVQTLMFEQPWKNPELWDLDKPNIYQLKLALRGAMIRDVYPDSFGFREIEIKGKEIYLNGIPFRMRPCVVHTIDNTLGIPEVIANYLRGFRHGGFNIQELWPTDDTERGTLCYNEEWARQADQVGMPLIYPVRDMSEYLRTWEHRGEKEAWLHSLEEGWKKIRNHPSILMLCSTPNRFAHNDDLNPMRLGNRERAKSGDKWKLTVKPAEEGIDLIRSLDPTRPVFFHHADVVRDFHAVNTYLNMIPLQEREEWLSEWAKTGDVPYCAVEFGTPLIVTMGRGRYPYMLSRFTEPLITEFSAIYLGAEAYRMESSEYRKSIAASFVKDQQYKTMETTPGKFGEPFQSIQDLFIRNTWRSWRTWGMTGGMVPWDYASGWKAWTTPTGTHSFPPFIPGKRGVYVKSLPQYAFVGMDAWEETKAGHALRKVNGPTLAWIGGSPDFVSKKHHFFSTEKLEKQIVVINDERTVVPYKVKWEVTVAGRSLKSGSNSGTIEAGKTLFLPVSVSLPLVDIKTDGVINLDATVNGASHPDSFSFRIYPGERPVSPATLVLWDPEGDTKAWLESLGWKTEAWNGTLGKLPVLVLGRRSLSSGKPLPGAVKAFVENGGTCIVFGQTPDWLRDHAGFRVSDHVSRRAFPLPGFNPVMLGLDSEDFRDWNGAGTLIAPEANTELSESNKGVLHGWRWGTRGSVASAAVEKPHRSNWTPLLEGEFDLAFTPLMEMRYGKGRLIYFGLDVENRGEVEPVARIITNRVLDHALKAPEDVAPARVKFLSKTTDDAVLKMAGVDYEKTDQWPESGVIVVSGDFQIDESKLKSFVREGGRAVLLPRRTELSFLGFQLKKDPVFAGGRSVPNWPETAGLSVSDVHLRTDFPALILDSGNEDSVGSDGIFGRWKEGKGWALAVQLDPTLLPVEDKTYFRYSTWRLNRMLAQIIANAGGSFQTAERCFEWEQNTDLPISLAGPWKIKIEKALPSIPSKSPERHPDTGNLGFDKGWAAIGFDNHDWQDIVLPSYWEDLGGAWKDLDGAVWFRRKVTLPNSWSGRDLTLSLGQIDDFDITYFNGVEVGGLDKKKAENAWAISREYVIPGKLVNKGENTLSIRIFDQFGNGGFKAAKGQMKIAPRADIHAESFYVPGYRTDEPLGDDPYRYERW